MPDYLDVSTIDSFMSRRPSISEYSPGACASLACGSLVDVVERPPNTFGALRLRRAWKPVLSPVQHPMNRHSGSEQAIVPHRPTFRTRPLRDKPRLLVKTKANSRLKLATSSSC